jgi:hypothetical protein
MEMYLILCLEFLQEKVIIRLFLQFITETDTKYYLISMSSFFSGLS